MVRVKQYTRTERGKRIGVPSHNRTNRPKAKKRIIGKQPVKLYPVYNEYHERLGWSIKKTK